MQRPPLLYKDLFSTHNINYGNMKDVLYIRKVYYMNKIYSKLRHSLPSIYENEVNRKNINLSAANLKLCSTLKSCHKLHDRVFHSLSSCSFPFLVYVRHFLNHTIVFFGAPSGSVP